MITTRSVTVDIVKKSDLPACLSTIGVYDACYVAASEGYLKLIERIWDEIEHKNLVSDGAALSNSQRDRRLWLLDTQGFYDAETAEIRLATGRVVTVNISSQRIWCSGTACDLEYLTPLSDPLPKPQVVSVNHNKRKAVFSGRLRANLAEMNALDQEILIRRMLTLVTEGIVLVVHLSKSPEMATALHNIIEPLSPFEVINDRIATRISYDYSSIDLNEATDLLLQIASELWTVIFLCKNQEVSDMLRSLVAEFAMPGPIIIG
jgi:hypothetical protein